MQFSVEQFGTLLGRFWAVFLGDLEHFGTADFRIWNRRVGPRAQLLVIRHNNGRRAEHQQGHKK
jgi:hypothetical protein